MIKKILDKQSLKTINDINEASAISEVKLLLDGDAMEDLHLLQQAFPESVNVNVINRGGERKHIKELEKIHNGSIYTMSEVRDMCMKYRLRFLPATIYKGNIPPELLQELNRKFTKENKLTHLNGCSYRIYQENLFIMAPASMFKIESTYSLRHRSLSDARKFRRLDPACFIKIDGNKYMFVKEWGNSFSFMRRILGMLTAKQGTLSLLFFLAWCAYVYIGVISMKWLWSISVNGFIPGEGWDANGYIFITLLVFVWLCISSLSWACSATCGWLFGSFKEHLSGFWKVNKNYATEFNWDKT